MTSWVRYRAGDKTGFGTLKDGVVSEYSGDMYAAPRPTGQSLPLASVELLPPSEPGKIIALWNNFHALTAKMNGTIPAEPLYLMKSTSSITSPGAAVARPQTYSGRVVYEGELGIVIGKRCSNISEEEAEGCIFGYTCVNDITALDIITKDPTFAQWVRAKSFDGFGPFGPVIVGGIDPTPLVIRLILNGQERQNYPVADMIFQPCRLVSLLSKDMTLMPGDLICCGTSVGVGTIKEPSNTMEVVIDGIGSLHNTFTQ